MGKGPMSAAQVEGENMKRICSGPVQYRLRRSSSHTMQVLLAALECRSKLTKIVLFTGNTSASARATVMLLRY